MEQQQPQQPQQPQYAQPTQGTPNSNVEQNPDARQWGMLAHLSAFSGLIGVPFGFVLGPVLVWQIKKNEHSFVDDQGKEAVNFQLSMVIYLISSALLMFVLIGFLLFPAILVTDIVLTIIAGLKANNGEYYRYPLTIRFFK